MLVAPELLARNFEYSLWASLTLLDAAAQLSPEALAEPRGNSFGGILDTFVHIYRADRVWLSRLQGNPVPFAPPGEVLTLADLRSLWPSLGAGLAAFAREQNEANFAKPFPWKNLQGLDKSAPLYRVLLHVVNHGTYHRGQITTMIRQAGGQPVSTDLIYYEGM
jgi:uncharacterized damage-inducible protein DinB